METKRKGGAEKIREKKETLRKIKLYQFKDQPMFFIHYDSVIE